MSPQPSGGFFLGRAATPWPVVNPLRQKKMLKGSIPAIITPFRKGEVDYDDFTRLLNWQIKNGII